MATDARLKDASVAAQLAAASLGDDQDSFKRMLNDPQKLLELIAAAEGSKSGEDGERDRHKTGVGAGTDIGRDGIRSERGVPGPGAEDGSGQRRGREWCGLGPGAGMGHGRGGDGRGHWRWNRDTVPS